MGQLYLIHKIMILKSVEFIKLLISMIKKDDDDEVYLFFSDIDESALVEGFLNAFDVEVEVCPFCHKKTLCLIRKLYERRLVIFKNGKCKEVTVMLPRCRCSSCKHTHVVFPPMIITPYITYSLPFVMMVLYEYSKREITIREICEKYQISAVTLYEWKKQYLEDLPLWLEAMGEFQKTHSEQTQAVSFDHMSLSVSEDVRALSGTALMLSSIKEVFSCVLSAPTAFADICDLFMQKNSRAFMQSHKSPSNCNRIDSDIVSVRHFIPALPAG